MTAVANIDCAHVNLLPNQDGLWLYVGYLSVPSGTHQWRKMLIIL